MRAVTSRSYTEFVSDQGIEYLRLLKNHIDITEVPFSDRGSRLLINRVPNTDNLIVKLAERLTAIDPDIEAYLHRPAFLRDFCISDEYDEPVGFEINSYPHTLELTTRLGKFGIVFYDERTFYIGLPNSQVIGLQFIVTPQHYKVDKYGGAFKSVRNIAYITNGNVLDNEIIPQQNGYLVKVKIQTDSDCSFVLSIQPGANLITEAMPFSVAVTRAAERWLDWFSRVPPVLEEHSPKYAYAWWIMANNLISPLGNVVYEAMTPSKVNYVGLWLWDNALHALAYRHMDPELARNQFRAMFAHQLPNGMLPDAVFDDGIVSAIDHPITGEVTKPPILAWSIMKLHEVAPDPEFLREVYIPLVRVNSWWFTMNDDDGDGLIQYNHPYSSGLDDNPLWDYGMPVESPDLNTYACIQMSSLAKIADILGLNHDAAVWRRRAEALVKRMIQDMWDPEVGLFWALKNDMPVPVRTPFNLFPLWTGLLPKEITTRLIQTLIDPSEFGGHLMIPTVSRSDPHYDPDTMWRGPIWTNVNYFFVEALRKNGFEQLSRDLRNKTLSLVSSYRDIYEYYNADTGVPPKRAANIFGWTAATYIDLAIQAFKDSELHK